MYVEIKIPEWIKRGSITIRLTELNPVATEALIETLRDANEQDDARVKLLIDFWESLTGDD